MPTNVIMPQLGESVVEGTVTRWLKREGETINALEPLVEVSTDKVDTEIPAPATGTILKIYVQEGTTVERGVLLAVIGAVGEPLTNAGPTPDAHGHAPSHGHSAPAPANAPSPTSVNDQEAAYQGHVTPVVARMVAEHGLDLKQLQGTGRDGRITKKDVESFLAARGNTPATPAASDLAPWERPGSGDLFKPTVEYGAPAGKTAANDRAAVQPTANAAAAPLAASYPATMPTMPTQAPQGSVTANAASGAPSEIVPLSAMRKSIADHMVRSKHTSPHVTTVFEVDMTAAISHRAANKSAFHKQGVNLTLTAYFAAATIRALSANPFLNAQWTDEGIRVIHTVNLGIAVALGTNPASNEGLIVPVIHNAQDLNLMGLARAINDISERARHKKLKADDVQGGTFTISNHGVTGSLFATPIINQPQVGILGVGMVEQRVKVIQGGIVARPCAYLSLTFDHRVVDGAAGDAFMTTLKQTLESFA
jgi:pyruvate/2-oxoglutarate dehydrogenase complex dihydrolipoamide acyltransferase (E2) component